jgi:hypothetical protein
MTASKRSCKALHQQNSLTIVEGDKKTKTDKKTSPPLRTSQGIGQEATPKNHMLLLNISWSS